MADMHHFNVEIAKEYGINCAVILQNLWHWIRHNEANGKNLYDGYYWTYNSTKAFKELFPYLSQKQIETALKKLRDDGIILTGNYNKIKCDRTLWYTITEKGKSILLAGEMHFTCRGNAFDFKVEPIPYNKPDNKPDNKAVRNSNEINEIIAYLNNATNKKFSPKTNSTQKLIRGRLAEGRTVEDFKRVIDTKTKQWLKDEKMNKFLKPDTLFTPTHFESYLNEETVKEEVNPYEGRIANA